MQSLVYYIVSGKGRLLKHLFIISGQTEQRSIVYSLWSPLSPSQQCELKKIFISCCFIYTMGKVRMIWSQM